MEADGIGSTTAGRGLLLQNSKQDEFSTKRKRGYTPYKNISQAEQFFKVLQSLREDEVLCDIKLQTDDETIIFGHKVVLASGSPYFREIFTSVEYSNTDKVLVRHVDSMTLKILVDFIYTAQIIITSKNVKVLLLAAIMLKLDDVRDACEDFLQAQLHPTNCLGIKDFAEMNSLKNLFNISQSYCFEHFSEVVECDEFLSMSYINLINLITTDELHVSSEEQVETLYIPFVNST